jgi:hypothetical protein
LHLDPDCSKEWCSRRLSQGLDAGRQPTQGIRALRAKALALGRPKQPATFLLGVPPDLSWFHRHCTPVRLSRGGCSCQFGRASAPMIPQFVQTIRGPNDVAAGYSFPQSTTVPVNREQLRQPGEVHSHPPDRDMRRQTGSPSPTGRLKAGAPGTRPSHRGSVTTVPRINLQGEDQKKLPPFWGVTGSAGTRRARRGGARLPTPTPG